MAYPVATCEKTEEDGCGRDLYPGDTACRSCGKATPAWVVDGPFVCPKCNADVHPLDENCARCEHPLSEPYVPVPDPGAGETSPEEQVASETPEKEEEVLPA